MLPEQLFTAGLLLLVSAIVIAVIVDRGRYKRAQERTPDAPKESVPPTIVAPLQETPATPKAITMISASPKTQEDVETEVVLAIRDWYSKGHGTSCVKCGITHCQFGGVFLNNRLEWLYLPAHLPDAWLKIKAPITSSENNDIAICPSCRKCLSL